MRLNVIWLVFCSYAFAQSTDLEHGKIEIRGFGGGINAGDFVAQPAFSAGVEGAIGLNHIVAVTGHYAFDHRNFDDLQSPVHEFMGGFRFSVPNHSRVTPYGAVSAGGASFRTPFSFVNDTLSPPTSTTHFALAIGPGVNYRISPRAGIFLDVRGVAISFGFDSRPGWFVRTTSGFYFRF